MIFGMFRLLRPAGLIFCARNGSFLNLTAEHLLANTPGVLRTRRGRLPGGESTMGRGGDEVFRHGTKEPEIRGFAMFKRNGDNWTPFLQRL